MRYFYIPFLLLVITYFTQGCNIINPKEPTPTYVHIDSFKFQPGNYSVDGSASHKITSIWAYYNNNPVGVFELPATFPVITNGNTGLLTIVPGVTVDGLSAFNTQYPFYLGDTSTLTTNAGQIKSYLPKTGYTSYNHLIYNIDFENGGNFQKIAGDTGIVVVTDSDKVFEGYHSGYILLTAAGDSSENIYQKTAPFVTGNGFIELNYKCTVQFAIGVEALDASGQLVTAYPEYIIGINPNSSWNKLYISLNSTASKYLASFQGAQFRLAIKSVMPDNQSTGYVLLDNIKYITD